MKRNKHTPLYLWIRSCKTINKVNEHSIMGYGFNGNQILDAFITKYLCIHKQTTVEKFKAVVGVMVDRYRTRYHSLGSDIQKVLYSRDEKAIVYVVHHEHYSEIFTKESENFAREQEKKRRAELRERKANMIKRADEDPTVLVVNRLNEEWLDKYYSVGLNDEVPEALKDVPNIHEIPAAHPPGVYILMQGDEVVYVGQSVNPSARLGKHTQDKVFDKAYLIPTNNLLETEAIYINKFKPKYNKRLY
jgi:predicted GIY-YIG superfamily endonuclease